MNPQFQLPRLGTGRAVSPAFTLVELLVSMVVLSIIMVVSASFVTQMQRTWTQSTSRIEQFREARMAFETITQSLRQATLNPYLAYRYNTGTTPTVPATQAEAPLAYLRHSELQFVTGESQSLLQAPTAGALVSHGMFFQAPVGVTERPGYEALNRLLCARGYFVLHGNDDAYRPAHVSAARTRFRLWEFRPPAERNAVYTAASWFDQAAKETVSTSESANQLSSSRPVAENIVALILSPQVTESDATLSNRAASWIAPAYSYNSRNIVGATGTNLQGFQHLLPPVVRVTLVAIDESSASRLAEGASGSMPDLLAEGAFKDCNNYQKDLEELESKLVAEKVNYRVFSAAVPLRSSKWNVIPQ